MMISLFGSAGIGLVWGWLVGSLIARVHRPYRTASAVALATFAVLASVFLYLSWLGVGIFLGAALFAFTIHAIWRHQILDRTGGHDVK
jgi:hypothetical protein